MQRARDEFLAAARFAVDQHGDVGVRQPPYGAKHLLHRRRLADDLGRPDFFRNLFGLLFARVRDGAAHHRHRVVDVERFRQIVERAGLIRTHRAFEVRVRRHDDDRQLRQIVMHAFEQRDAVDARHANVADDHVRLLARQPLQHRVAVVERHRRHSGLFERAFEHPPNRTVVVDDPYVASTTCHAAAPKADRC